MPAPLSARLTLVAFAGARTHAAHRPLGGGGQAKGRAACQRSARPSRIKARQGAGEALSLMVSTIASMVQAARGTNSRWNAG